MRPVGEVEVMQGVAAMADSGVYGSVKVCSAIMGTCDLRHPNAEAVLLEMVRCSRNFRGVRCDRRHLLTSLSAAFFRLSFVESLTAPAL